MSLESLGRQPLVNSPYGENREDCEADAPGAPVRKANILGSIFVDLAQPLGVEPELSNETSALPLETKAQKCRTPEPMREKVLGCAGCAEVGYCRRGPDQEQLSPNCMASTS